jgi:hypothetical protein
MFLKEGDDLFRLAANASHVVRHHSEIAASRSDPAGTLSTSSAVILPRPAGRGIVGQWCFRRRMQFHDEVSVGSGATPVNDSLFGVMIL